MKEKKVQLGSEFGFVGLWGNNLALFF